MIIVSAVRRVVLYVSSKAGQLATVTLTPSHISYEPHIYYIRGLTAGLENEDTSIAGSNMAQDEA